jgi:hypothetical protein
LIDPGRATFVARRAAAVGRFVDHRGDARFMKRAAPEAVRSLAICCTGRVFVALPG